MDSSPPVRSLLGTTRLAIPTLDSPFVRRPPLLVPQNRQEERTARMKGPAGMWDEFQARELPRVGSMEHLFQRAEPASKATTEASTTTHVSGTHSREVESLGGGSTSTFQASAGQGGASAVVNATGAGPSAADKGKGRQVDLPLPDRLPSPFLSPVTRSPGVLRRPIYPPGSTIAPRSLAAKDQSKKRSETAEREGPVPKQRRITPSVIPPVERELLPATPEPLSTSAPKGKRARSKSTDKVVVAKVDSVPPEPTRARKSRSVSRTLPAILSPPPVVVDPPFKKVKRAKRPVQREESPMSHSPPRPRSPARVDVEKEEEEMRALELAETQRRTLKARQELKLAKAKLLLVQRSAAVDRPVVAEEVVVTKKKGKGKQIVEEEESVIVDSPPPSPKKPPPKKRVKKVVQPDPVADEVEAETEAEIAPVELVAKKVKNAPAKPVQKRKLVVDDDLEEDDEAEIPKEAKKVVKRKKVVAPVELSSPPAPRKKAVKKTKAVAAPAEDDGESEADTATVALTSGRQASTGQDSHMLDEIGKGLALILAGELALLQPDSSAARLLEQYAGRVNEYFLAESLKLSLPAAKSKRAKK